MNNLVKFGLIAAGGYILYKAYENGIVTPTPGTTQSTGNQPTNANSVGGANASPQATPTPTVQSLVTSQQLYEAINYAPGSGATPDQWSYAFAHSPGGFSISGDLIERAFGTVGTVSRGKNYSVDEFISIIKANGGTGLAGLHGLSGMTRAKANWFERASKYQM